MSGQLSSQKAALILLCNLSLAVSAHIANSTFPPNNPQVNIWPTVDADLPETKCLLHAESPPGLFKETAILLSGDCKEDSALKLEFLPYMDNSTAQYDGQTPELKTLALLERKYRIDFDCWNFIQPGAYRASIETNNRSGRYIEWLIPYKDSAIGSSPILPQLDTDRSGSIFPRCADNYSVSWHLPNCDTAGVVDFRIRVLAAKSLRNLGAEMIDWIYMEEFRVENTSHFTGTISIPCAQFDILYDQYCFELISTEKSSRHFELWDRKCVHTEAKVLVPNDKRNIQEWSTWSSWTKCSTTASRAKHRPNKLRPGYTKRSRQCITVKAVKDANGVDDWCAGRAVEVKRCNDLIVGTFLPTSAIHKAVLTNSSSGSCECGCNLAWSVETPSPAVFFAGLPNCPNIKTQWTLNYLHNDNQDVLVSAELLLSNEITREGDLFRIVGDNETLLMWDSHEHGLRSLMRVELGSQRALMIEYMRSGVVSEGASGVYVHYVQSLRPRGGKKTDVLSHAFSSFSTALSAWVYNCTVIHESSSGELSGRNACGILKIAIPVLLLVAAAIFFIILPPILLAQFLPKAVLFTCKEYGEKGDNGSGQNDEDRDSLTMISSPTKSSCDNMFRSGATGLTQLTSMVKCTKEAAKPSAGVLQRSVGIQSSRSTPRSTHRSTSNIGDHRTDSRRGKPYGTVSNASLASGNTADGDELEYDYSFLRPSLTHDQPPCIGEESSLDGFVRGIIE